MSGRRGRRPVLICLIVLCLACVALMTKAVISFVSFSPRYDPVADEPEVLFDLNASDYGERMRIVPLSGGRELRGAPYGQRGTGAGQAGLGIVVARRLHVRGL